MKEDSGRDLAQWLLEVGRRRPPRQLDLSLDAAQTKPQTAPAPRSLVRQTVMLTALVAAYLQYFYLNVFVQIASLPTLVIYTTLR